MTLRKYGFLILNLFLSILISNAQSAINENKEVADTTAFVIFTPNQIPLTDSIINYGRLFLNTPYRYGSSGSASFDCSGFTSYVFRNFGYDLKRSSSEQAEQFDTVSRHELKKGDLVYFAGRRRSKHVGHVGIVIEPRENGAFDFIHAAVHGGVTISKSEEKYYTDRFVKANRVIGFNPLLAVELRKESLNVNQSNDIIPPMAVPVKQIKKTIPAKYHRVKAGETLSEIAERYGLSVKELKKKNRLKGSKIDIKQALKIKDAEVIMIAEPMKNIASKSESLNDSITKSSIDAEEIRSQAVESKSHIVKRGETLFSISKVYNVTIDEIKKANNMETGKIMPGQELKIHAINNLKTEEKQVTIASDTPSTHKVKSGETISTIAKKYNLSVEKLKKLNQLKNSTIQPNQELKIVESDIAVNNTQTETTVETIKYKVKKGESLFSIAKQFNIKIEDLKAANNMSSNAISIGQELFVNANGKELKEKQNSQIVHKVKSGESYYSLAKKYGCTVAEIKEWNDRTDNKLNIGDKIKIQTK